MVTAAGGPAGGINQNFANRFDPAFAAREARADKYLKEQWRLYGEKTVIRPKSNVASNVIEGLNEAGLAAKLRKKNTDFGSGWRGLAEFLEPILGGKMAAKLLREGTAEQIFTKTVTAFKKGGGKFKVGEHLKGGLEQGQATVFVPEAERAIMKEIGTTINQGGKLTSKHYTTMRNTMHEIMEAHVHTTRFIGKSNIKAFYRGTPEARVRLSQLGDKIKNPITSWGLHGSKVPVEVELAFSARVGTKFFEKNVAFREAELLVTGRNIGRIKQALGEGVNIPGMSRSQTMSSLMRRREYQRELPELLAEHQQMAAAGAFRRKTTQASLHKAAQGAGFRGNANRRGSHGVQRT